MSLRVPVGWVVEAYSDGNLTSSVNKKWVTRSIHTLGDRYAEVSKKHAHGIGRLAVLLYQYHCARGELRRGRRVERHDDL
jgi:hypothetical protein